MSKTRVNPTEYSAPAEENSKNGVLSIFLLGTDEKYYKPDDDRNNKDSDHYEKDFAKKVIEKKSIHTSFYEACTGEKLLMDGPQGIRSPQRIKQMIDIASHAVQAFVANAEPDKNGQYTINLSGFSRGAACCTRVANKLQEMLDNGELKDKKGSPITLNDINVNICASDPVPGIYDKKDKDVKTIPPIVKNYVATLQINERRPEFLPADLSRAQVVDPVGTQVHFIPLLGNHSETNKVKDANVLHSALLHYDIKFAFLTRHGSKFKYNQLPSIATAGDDTLVAKEHKSVQTPQALLEYYALAESNRAIYEARGVSNGQSVGRRGDRSFTTTYKNDYVSDPFFINQHERELFKKTYPKTFNYLFEQGAKDPNDIANTGGIRELNNSNGGYTRKDLNNEVDVIKDKNPQLMKKLLDKKQISIGFKGTVMPYILYIGGNPQIETCRLLSSLSGEPVKPLSHPEILRMNLSENIFSIKREKKDHKNFKIGMQLRGKLDDIIHSGKSDDEKFKLMMDMLTKEVQAYAKVKNKTLVNALNKAINYVTAVYDNPKNAVGYENTLSALHQMHSADEIKASKEVVSNAERMQQLHKLSRMCSAIELTDSPVISRAVQATSSTSSDEARLAAKKAARALAKSQPDASPELRTARQEALAKRAGMDTVIADTLTKKDRASPSPPQEVAQSATSIKLRGN